MNDFDPWTSPRSYSVPFNPTQPANHAATNKRRRRSTGRGIFLLVLSIGAALAAIGFSLSSAQEEQVADIAELKGQTIGVTAIICLLRPDADALLMHIQHGGVAEATPYMRSPDNSCFLDDYTVVVGAVLDAANAPDGKAWNIVAAASADGRLRAFMVTSKLLTATRDTAGVSRT
jgi:hypothetical protein